MDNRISSNLKRSLKIITSYITALIIFAVFAGPAVSLGKDSTPAIMQWLSFAVFCLLFFIVYVEMRNCATKEKRPQYNINPPPYKGLLYGLIAAIPIVVVQCVIIFISVPQDLLILRWRVFQAFSGPVYWFARILGNMPTRYMIAIVVSILAAAFSGYLAGHNDFYLAEWVRRKLGIKRKKKEKKKARH